MLGSDFDVTGTETVRQTGQTFLEKLRSEDQQNPGPHGATPFPIASDITGLALRHHPGSQVRFLEPCLGTGIFFSTLLHEADNRGDSLKIVAAHGVEREEQFAVLAHDLWAPAGLTVHELDFLTLGSADAPKATMVLSRPPVTQHHRLSSAVKIRAADAAEAATGIRPTGLTDLYNHFVLATHQFLADGAVSGAGVADKFLHLAQVKSPPLPGVEGAVSASIISKAVHWASAATAKRSSIGRWWCSPTRPPNQPTRSSSQRVREIFGADTSTTVTYGQLASSWTGPNSGTTVIRHS